MFKQLQAFRCRHPRGSLFIFILLILTVLFIALRIALSPAIIFGATSWLKDQGIDANIDAIEISFTNGSLHLKNVTGNKNGEPLFNINLIELHWQWKPLTSKTITVNKIVLDTLSIPIKHYQDVIIIGGVRLPLAQADTQSAHSRQSQPMLDASAEENVQAWAASLGEVTFNKLNICYLQHTAILADANQQSLFVDYCVELDEMLWTGNIRYADDTTSPGNTDMLLTSSGDFTLNGLSIIDNKLNRKLLESKSNTLNDVVITGLNKLQIKRLDMKQLSLLQRDDEKHIDALRFSRLLINDITLTNLNSLSIDNIKIDQPGLYLVKENKSQWEFEQWLPPSQKTPSPPNEATTRIDSKSSGFKFSLNNVIIEHSDLCYLDQPASLYYCLTMQQLNWQGKINFDSEAINTATAGLLLQGDLGFEQPALHNHSIDRKLLEFDSLALSRLEVTNDLSVSVEDLKLDHLTAMQRSKKTDDNSISFEQLAINNIQYQTDALSINSIALSGLAAAFSKNKNGTWEHDKWLSHEKNNHTNEVSSTKTTDQTTPEINNKDAFIIALSKLEINTDKSVSFTDNSTQPTMTVGLNEFNLELNKLYSNKPTENTDFKLFAKTTRHGTIDLAGTAKPFAEKISFDASGKLKGFDLRAASPATKKAIGHTIKSGQLDADLTLLAIDGQLDSNIALSLHHFNIKAGSKQDADKLNEKFGMPLNQTLVLLRDKDDSIHLDIPITGDVNNPSFNPMDAIIKATSKAATVTLITFYTPYGLIYAGGHLAFNLATALNFDPIEFPPGESKLSDSGKQQLDGLSKLLTEKPKVHLTLCGVTNQHDALALYPKLKEPIDTDKKTTDIKLNKEQLLQLKQLARERQVNSKNHLVDNSGIEHNRLILCEPEHNTDDDAIAGVVINI